MIFLLGLSALGIAILYGPKAVELVDEALPAWRKFDHLFLETASRYSVNWTWLKAIALNESDLGREKSVAKGLEFPQDIEGSKSSDGKSWGLMQVTLSTAKTMDPGATPVKLNNAAYSIDLAARYVQTLSKMFPKSDPRFLEWVVKSYNQGPGNTNKEKSGVGGGFANEYWERFKRNLKRVEGAM